jgi:hypothetical protein
LKVILIAFIGNGGCNENELPEEEKLIKKVNNDKTKDENDPSWNTDQGVLALCKCYGSMK